MIRLAKLLLLPLLCASASAAERLISYPVHPTQVSAFGRLSSALRPTRRTSPILRNHGRSHHGHGLHDRAFLQVTS
jgi:hypothetical protein